MKNLGVGKIDRKTSYRILEAQQKYIENLVREKMRRNVDTDDSKEMRYLLDLGIQMHREGRREKFEMSNYFKGELRNFTNNFFKENNENYLGKLNGISMSVKFIAHLLMECLSMLFQIYSVVCNIAFDADDAPEVRQEILGNFRRQSEAARDQTVRRIKGFVGDFDNLD